MAATVRWAALLVFLSGAAGSVAGCGSDSTAEAFIPMLTPTAATAARLATPIPTATALPPAT
ncbi:MAG: hypothetical protein ACRERC_19765 [Candidatus Binatia bacterium]